MQSTEPPYPPSWIDRFIAWIDGLPSPTWLFYALAVLAIALLITTIRRIDYELATLPRWLGWLAIAIGFLSTPPYFVGDPVAFRDRVPQTALPYVVAVAAASFFAATFSCLVIRSIRQLRMVHKLHAQATKVILLNLEATHAFSALTAKTGIGVVLVVILGYLYNPGGIDSSWVIFTYLAIALLTVAIFVVPVIGMRERLKQEKERAL